MPAPMVARITVGELSALITRRLIARSEREPNPERYLAEAAVRLLAVETWDGLIQFGAAYEILSPELSKEN